MTVAGFPHSGITGSQPACGSPMLFAAYRALPRLSVPRHPPCALVRLTGISSSCAPSASSLPEANPRFARVHSVSLLAPLLPNFPSHTRGFTPGKPPGSLQTAFPGALAFPLTLPSSHNPQPVLSIHPVSRRREQSAVRAGTFDL
jgi:hypothetical protein